ncbi:WD40-repeat-containing domain protein [Hyaloraphidium curvatum]|nr:WD40-repeat-containing domain protein [Hyaloraphidium curvatum]
MEPWTASEGQLRKLMLKRILKENHGADINQIAFNFRRRSMLGDSAQISAEMLVGDSPNIVATVGGPQANIYDNEHDVDHLDIMSHFVLAGEAGATGGTSSAGELRTCCWLRSPHDAILAVAGTSGVIHILSLAFSAELRQLQGHSGTVHDLQAHPMDDDILLSVASDGTARLWHVPSGQCLASLLIDRPSAICFQPSGEGFLVATSRGDVWNCSVPNEIGLLRKQLASVQADGEWASIEALRLAVDACGSKMKLHPGEIGNDAALVRWTSLTTVSSQIPSWLPMIASCASPQMARSFRSNGMARA